MIRILGGKCKGRGLVIPSGIRAIDTRIKKALFDILASIIVDSKVADFFAGSGALGLEALSRGARKAVFVERDKRCHQAIGKNLKRLNLSDECLLISKDVFKAIPLFFQRKENFEIIFIDPPYYQGLAKKTLQCLAKYDILTVNALAVVKHYKKDELPEVIGKISLWRRERYGDTALSFYKQE